MVGMEYLPPPPRSEAGMVRALADVERGLAALERLIAAQRETIGLLALQLAARTREVRELHELLRAAQAQALQAPRRAVPPHALYEPVSIPARQVRRRRPRWRRWLVRLLGE